MYHQRNDFSFVSDRNPLWPLSKPDLKHYFFKTIDQPRFPSRNAPQWGAADAEIKVPSGVNTELKRSPFKAWSRSVYNHTCYAYCQEFLPCVTGPFKVHTQTPMHGHRHAQTQVYCTQIYNSASS